MSKQISNRNNLGYLGVDFQYKLIKCFIEDNRFFESIQHIVDQNMFSEDSLRRIVGFMKDRYAYSETTPTYFDIETLIRSKVNDDNSRDIMLAVLDEIKKMDLSGMDIVEKETEKFFKQQNLTKAINKAVDIIKKGNSSDYYVIEDLVKKALETNTKRDLGFHLFENVEADLRENYRQPISTGTPQLDAALYGGLGRGELGLVVAPMGVGKAQPLNARILTPEGFKTMGDMFVGCKVLGEDGRSYEVSGVFPQGKRPIYKVMFSNNTSCECDIEHLWTVSSDGVNFETLTLKEILSNIKSSQLKTYQLPQYSIMEFNEQEVPEDAYVYGMTFMKKIIDTNILSKYVFNSLNIRKEFLHGLLHSGLFKYHFSERDINTYEIVSIKKEIGFLLNIFLKSIGCQSRITDIDDKNCKIIWKSTKKSEKVYINGIEYVREDEAQCIMVDSESHLYITEDFIVTHNTSIMTGFAASAALYKTENNNFNGYKVLHYFFEDSEVNIRRKYYGYLLDIDACELSLDSQRPIAISRLQTEYPEERKMLKENIICKRLTTGEVTASEIKEMIKAHIARGFKPDLVIIDYFECLKPERGGGLGESEWTKEGITMRKLESICNDLEIALWVPVQGTKGSIGLDVVGLQHAGGSVSKTQIGHVILTLARNDAQKSQGRLNLFVEKLRAVKIGRDKFFNVKFNNGTGKFDMSDLDDVDSVIASDQAQSQQVARDVQRNARR